MDFDLNQDHIIEL